VALQPLLEFSKRESCRPVNQPHRLAGVFCVFQTPYLADESIDYDTLAREIEWLFERGADGVVMAMVSEVLRLSQSERREMADKVCGVASGRPVVVSVGAESWHTACDYARHAQQAGASALMAVPPISTALDDDALFEYFLRIAQSVDIPLIVQDASSYVGRPMSIDLFVRLFESLGPRVLFKPEAVPIGPRLSALRSRTANAARVFEGTGGIALVDSFRRGIVGTMPGADLVDAIVAIWRALVREDWGTAERIWLPLAALVSLQHSLDAFLAVEKHLLVRQCVFKNTIVRGPRAYELDEVTREHVDRLFDRMMGEVAASPATPGGA
jgi:dihydrodipicolinate synthase/N-acetylneuraminate lyase